MSATVVLYPRRPKVSASWAAVVVFPDPPFWLKQVMIFDCIVASFRTFTGES
jgi:hypothetical protein